jgi:BolA-like protein 3
MYAVHVSSLAFKGASLVKQHKMVVSVIEKEIKAAHGVQINTEVPRDP